MEEFNGEEWSKIPLKFGLKGMVGYFEGQTIPMIMLWNMIVFLHCSMQESFFWCFCISGLDNSCIVCYMLFDLFIYFCENNA